MMTEEYDIAKVRELVNLHLEQSRLATDRIPVNNLPNLAEFNKSAAGSFYYVIDFVAGRFTYFTESIKDLFGISADDAIAMEPAEFLMRLSHPEDLPSIFQISEDWHAYCKTLPIEKLKDTRLLSCWRVKNTKGEYVKIVNQTSILSISPDKTITQTFAALSVAAFISDFEVATAVVVDITNGEELQSFSPKTKVVEDRLTKREIQVLRLLAVGYKNKEVGERLGISVHTVETHRKHIMSKLGVSTAIDLVWKAIEYNLIDT